ncbi:hypothetical protein Tco_1322194, partial [Tanacetum coccineum]
MAAGISTTYPIAAMAEVIGLVGKGGVVQLFHLTSPPTDTHDATLFDAASLFVAAVNGVWRWKIELLRILAGRPIRFAAMADGSFFPLADRNKPLNGSFDVHNFFFLERQFVAAWPLAQKA